MKSFFGLAALLLLSNGIAYAAINEELMPPASREVEVIRAEFGLFHPEGAGLCWVGSQEWHHDGAGRTLAWSLWQDFLAAGGPWPTEFELRAGPDMTPPGAGEHTFFRAGVRCGHVWQMLPKRDRPGSG